MIELLSPQNMHASTELVEFGHALSRLFGWIYFAAWSLSFYPQLIQNHRRRSVTGLSADFFTINVIGFLAYTVSTALFLFSPTIREQYAVRHPKAPNPTVQYNDLAFGVHALLLAFLMWCQFWFCGFKREASQRLGNSMLGLIIGSAIVLTFVSLLGFFQVGSWEALDAVYTIGFIKVLITVVKYIPQAHLNFQRKSTVGWSIHNILLDSAGGVLSLAQLFLDSALSGDLLGGTFGNPMKMGLGVVTLGFDGIFIAQHFVWYRGNNPVDVENVEERGPLIGYGTLNPSDTEDVAPR